MSLELAGGLVVLDLDRRTYMGLAHDGTYWHLIRPRRPEEAPVGRYVEPGELVCGCAGGQRHGTCWRLEQARAHERSVAEEAAWGLPADAREEVPA